MMRTTPRRRVARVACLAFAVAVASAWAQSTPAGLVVYPKKLPNTYHLVTYPTGWTYSLETTDGADTVNAWYVAHVSGMHLTAHNDNELGDTYTYDWTNGGRWNLQIVEQHGEHTQVSMSLIKGAPGASLGR